MPIALRANMPGTFEQFGLRFLYPDNWVQVGQEIDPDSEGVMLDLPQGGFFSVTRYLGRTDPEQLLGEIAQSVAAEYTELETDELAVSDADHFYIESRFYYLDLLVTCRLTAIETPHDTIVVQMQAESREFDANEPVFAAILQSLEQSLKDDDPAVADHADE